MDTLQIITAAVVGNVAVLGVLGWLAKSLLEKLIQRDSKRFEIELKAKADLTMEQLKGDLQLRTIEHQVKFSSLHEKRATVIAELTAHIVEALWNSESFLSPVEWSGEPTKIAKHATAMNKLAHLFRYFDKHRIYLPEPLCVVVEQLIKEVRSLVNKYAVYLAWEDAALQEHTRKDKSEALMNGWNAITTQVPLVRRQLEDEFRSLLGPQT